jgi:sugar phosphate isomerase/epimerase
MLFLKESSLFCFILIILAGCSNTEENKFFHHDLGLAPFTFRHSFPHGVAATLDTIRDLGFTIIEGGGGDMDPKEYKALCEERGISIPSTGADYNTLLENPEPVIERAKIYDAEYVVCFWIPHDGDSFTLEDARQAAKDFNTIGKKLKENGLTFAYHPHGYEFQRHEEGTLLDYLMENTDPELVAYEMDVFWIQFGGGDPVALLKKYPDRWKLMHLKDMKDGIEKNLSGGTDHEYSVTLGTGQIAMDEVIRTAMEIGVEYYFIEDESSRIAKQLPESIIYLRELKN